VSSKLTWLVVLLVCGLISGCGPKTRGLPTAKVTGTVQYKEKPLQKGKIVFQHPSGEMAVGEFGADGKYETMVPIGKNLVMIDAKSSNLEKAGAGSQKEMEVFTPLVPDRYLNFETSKLELEVPEAGTTFDVNVTK